MGPLREMPRILVALHLTQISAGFHRQNLWGLLFLALEPWAGGPSVGLGLLTPHGEPTQSRYASPVLTVTVGVGPACSLSPPLLPVSIWLLLYILSYRTMFR